MKAEFVITNLGFWWNVIVSVLSAVVTGLILLANARAVKTG
jgi:hypothetical protein